MTPPSATHLVLIPSYNTGRQLADTVNAALAEWAPVWVVVDGSTDQSAAPVQALAERDPRVRVLVRARNGGKGAAIATGVDAALAVGFTHVLTMDSDGQHPADHICTFMAASAANPAALVVGRPIFGAEVPLERLHGRKLSVALARLEILGRGIDDPLFGFRVYPAAALQRALVATRSARGFDFDPEIAVRLVWAGVPTVNLPAPCRYLTRTEGGVSHFHYVRDNLKLIWLHTRLLTQLLFWRWPRVLRQQRSARQAARVALFLLVALAIHAAPKPLPDEAALAADQTVITDPAHDPAWKDLFDRIAVPKPRISDFEERRYFSFRSTPVVLKGEIRISPGHGLSLHYSGAKPHIVIIDGAGVLMRDEHGPDRAAPAEDHVQAATSALFHILNFDLPALAQDFVVHGQRNGDAWALGFVPRATPIVAVIGTVIVRGELGRLDRIDMIRTESQRIEILITNTREDVVFPPDVLARYFR